MVFTGFVYYQRIGGLLYLHADVLPFCIFPWLLLWGLNLINYCHKCTGISFMDSLQLHTRSITFGLSCGLVYWLKYSGFISIAALLTGVCLWILIKCKNFSLQKRIFVCSSISTALLPVILLNLVNLNFSGVYSLADEANTAGFNQDTVGFIDLFFSIIVGPGLSLFNFHSIAQHFFCFMDPTFPFLKKFCDFSDRIVWMPLLAIPLISFFIIYFGSLNAIFPLKLLVSHEHLDYHLFIDGFYELVHWLPLHKYGGTLHFCFHFLVSFNNNGNTHK